MITAAHIKEFYDCLVDNAEGAQYLLKFFGQSCPILKNSRLEFLRITVVKHVYNNKCFF